LNALFENTEGIENTAVGRNSGRGITTGSGNSIFGADADDLASDLENNLILASGGVIRLQHDGVNTTTLQGNLVADKITASTGILFGTDTAAANTLDDYEEGAWTPVTNSVANMSSPSVTAAEYTKIGNLVFAQISGSFSVTSAASLETFLAYTLPIAQASGNVTLGGGGSVQSPSGLNVNPAVRDISSDTTRGGLEFISYETGSHDFQIAITYRGA
jgi:translation initiation factor 1 (eIF-1/SUI1)